MRVAVLTSLWSNQRRPGNEGSCSYKLVDAIRGDLGMRVAVRMSLWMQSEATWE